MTVLQSVDLVDGDDHGHAEREHTARDEVVPRADPIAGGDDEQHGVDVVERGIDRSLHALGERVHRSLEPGEIDEHELPVRAVGDAEDPTARRVRHLRRDRDLVPCQRVDERRLADVRPSGNGDEPAPHDRHPRTIPAVPFHGLPVEADGAVVPIGLVPGPPASSPRFDSILTTPTCLSRDRADCVPVAPPTTSEPRRECDDAAS